MTIFTDKAIQYMPRLMRDLNLTKVQAAGVFGNIGAETGGFTALQEIKPTVAGSRGGYGWLQWTGKRRKKYEAWCKEKGFNPALDETNYQYLVLETKTDEVHSLEQLRKTTTIEAATETFMAQNLRPGVKNLKARIDYAHKAFEAYHEEKTAVDKTVIVGGGAVAGTVIVASSPHHVWAWIIGGTVVIVGLIVWLVHEARKQEKQEVLSTKGKK